VSISLEAVREEGLLRAGRPVVVLFSGGRDSTCLLDLAVRIAGDRAVSALHVNYALRDEAGADERHCSALCERLGVELEVRRPHRPEAGNLQSWARDERYGAAAQIAIQRRADVAAGHTATDQVETILYRLASSPSRRALLGMRPRDGSLVRPLLRYTRAQTAEYCSERGLEWREDESNEQDAYARARIRSQLVPALREIHPAAEENVLALAAILRDEAAVLDAAVDAALDGRGEIALARLRALPEALRALVVQRLADGAAGGPAPGTARRAAEIAALPDRGRAAVDLPHGVRAVAEAGIVSFERTPVSPPGRPGDTTGARSAPNK
jgi:tRNA(Ile)-lysidine synthase